MKTTMKMKLQCPARLCILPLLFPGVALAQNGAAPANNVPAAAKTPLAMEPGARELLESVTTSYKDASGISYTSKVMVEVPGRKRPESITLVCYARPAKLAVFAQNGTRRTVKIVADGTNIYQPAEGVPNEYFKDAATPEATFMMMGQTGAGSSFIASLLAGKNPFATIKNEFASPMFQQFKDTTVKAVAPRTVDGETLQGLQYVVSATVPRPGAAPRKLRNEVTAWFGGTPPLLRSVQSRMNVDSQGAQFVESINEQKLAPTFADDVFVFNTKGLKLAELSDDVMWDPRLKVGAAPFAFSAPDLNGKTISLQKLKGKVVLLDFWATWCGPCVELMPSVRAVYKKYHAKGLEVVGISLDENKGALTAFIRKNQMPWPQIFDGKGWSSRVPKLYGIQGIPCVIIVGRDGKIAAIEPQGSLENAVKAALAKK